MRIYRATHNSDMTEGKGSPVTIGLFDNPEAAYEAAKGQGVMGYGDGDVEYGILSSFYDSTADFRWVRIFGYHNQGTRYNTKWTCGWHNGYESMNATHPVSR